MYVAISVSVNPVDLSGDEVNLTMGCVLIMKKINLTYEQSS